MKTIKLVGYIDEQHKLHANVPNELPPSEVRVIVLLPDEDEAGSRWADGVAREWAAELEDPRQDLYTSDDGSAVMSDEGDVGT